MRTRDELLDQLRRQIGFLERSCQGFDDGFVDEAIRIAVSIRILLQNTRNQTSLLTLLGERVKLLSSTEEPHPDAILAVGGLSFTRLTQGDAGLTAFHKPVLSESSFYAEIDVAVWWNQTIQILPDSTKINRKLIVLSAANKDGGAHVDPKLNKEYQQLIDGVSHIVTYDNGIPIKRVPIPDSHFTDLRQLGYEVLHSPDILKLVQV